MTVHLIKLAVGVRDVAHLAEIQARLMAEDGRIRHFTRNTPRRAKQVLDGGSLYRVIKGVLQVRQRIIAIDRAHRADGSPACALTLDPLLVRVRPRTMRAFQGWRYLDPADAPPDLEDGEDPGTDMPPEMMAELRELGLL